MGVPKFFRWISERYPKINQPIHAPPNRETQLQYFPNTPPSNGNGGYDNLNSDGGEDPNSSSSKLKQDSKVYMQKNSILPEFDRLYLDMNGIIHCCSHNNASDDNATIDPDTKIEPELNGPPSEKDLQKLLTDSLLSSNKSSGQEGTVQITEEEIFRNVCYYVDRIVTDIVKPNELVYMAIDGVAPRAKMNQQRSRRYRSGKEHEIEKTFYQASLLKQKKEQEMMESARSLEKDLKNRYDYNDDEVDSFNFVNMDGEYEYNRDNVSRSLQNQQKKNTSINDEDYSVFGENSGDVKEVEPGRFTGKFETSGKTKASSTLRSGSNSARDSLSSNPVTSSESNSSSDEESNELFDLDYEDFLKSIQEIQTNDEMTGSRTFHSNEITPGTPFFERCTAHLQNFIKRKLHSDPRWAHLTIIFSGPRTPGEGEHKIMDFIRNQKHKKDYNPNTRHCLFGQDGDLIMLGLATHEPHFALLREEVVFDQSKKKAQLQMLKAAKEKQLKEQVAAAGEDGLRKENLPVLSENLSASIDSYIHNANFELLHMPILRDYLAYEFETKDVVPTSPFELEQTIDDFVFMTFFVGNDFWSLTCLPLLRKTAFKLPHMPAIDIADEAFDLLFYTYKRIRWKWLKGNKGKNHKKHPYLTNSGRIVSGQRLETFLSFLGKHEDPYYNNKQRTLADENQRMRKADLRAGRDSSVPPEDILAAREEWERENYKEMLKTIATQQDAATQTNGFKPVATQSDIFNEMEMKKKSYEFKPEDSEEEELEEGFVSRMGTLFRNSLSSSGDERGDVIGDVERSQARDDDDFDEHVEDLKGRYYYDKFKFSPLDAEKHIALRKAYIEGLVWNLEYYYKGCSSWEWFYPYHYGPMLSDLKDINNLLKQISFHDDDSEPLQPFEQLMANLPPSSAELLPLPYQWLMKSPKSPIVDFYPKGFTVDMNGKRWPWEAVVLLPFIDSAQLVSASRDYVKDDLLSDDEKSRNKEKEALVYTRDESYSTDLAAIKGDLQNFEAISNCNVREQYINSTSWKDEVRNGIAFRPKLLSGTLLPFPGFPSLKDAPVQALRRRKLGINIFGFRSRYRTAVLEMNSDIPMIASATTLAGKFIGTTLHFRYPFLQEGFVTALSDSETTVRGKEAPRRWTEKESRMWKMKNEVIHRQYVSGEGLTGSGGWDIPESNVTLSVRPLKEIQTLADGRQVKVYARLEIEVPFIAALWSPSQPDPRFANIPARLEKNPYRFGSEPLSPSIARIKRMNKSSRRGSKDSNKKFQQKAKSLFTNFSAQSSSKGILPPRLTETVQKNSAGGTKGFCTTTWQAYNDKRRVNGLMKEQRLKQIRTTPSLKRRSIQVAAIAAACLFQGIDSKSTHSHSFLPSLVQTAHISLADKSHISSQIKDDSKKDADEFESTPPPPLEYAHGTTTLSFTFDGGIIAAVDSRASIGNFVGSKTTQKVLPITNHIIGTMAGGAADCSFWIRRLQAESKHFELANGKPISVARLARVLADYLYQNRALDLSVGTMIMGFDNDHGASIYYIDNNGSRFKNDLFAVGSGATFALGVLDTERKNNMNEDEAVALAIKAIRHATFRDAFSGGYIAVYVIKKSGWSKVFSEDLALLDHA